MVIHLILVFLVMSLSIYSATDEVPPRHRRTSSFSMKRPSLPNGEKDKTVATLAAALHQQLTVQEEVPNPLLSSASDQLPPSPLDSTPKESQPTHMQRSAQPSWPKMGSSSHLSRQPSSLTSLAEETQNEEQASQ